MISASPGPCPYHRPGQDCDKREDCPIARYVPAAKCEALTATGIKIVQEWMEA